MQKLEEVGSSVKARIKKIMQADEDVGKIALAVPVLVSKALELFLQDLCDRTYEITLQRGAKTMNSLHLRLNRPMELIAGQFHMQLGNNPITINQYFLLEASTYITNHTHCDSKCPAPIILGTT
ncbi:hypothetical protein JHK84_032954 [Glycine max]|nr:hypothetical protein JHK85_033334 [Glycine max]KAG5139186.1 hypothetical protein JHK84_032954 [Glycine max]